MSGRRATWQRARASPWLLWRLASRSLVAAMVSPSCRSVPGCAPPTLPSQLALHCGRRSRRFASLSPTEQAGRWRWPHRDCFVASLLAVTGWVSSRAKRSDLDGAETQAPATTPSTCSGDRGCAASEPLASRRSQIVSLAARQTRDSAKESVRHRATVTTAADELADRSLVVHSCRRVRGGSGGRRRGTSGRRFATVAGQQQNRRLEVEARSLPPSNHMERAGAAAAASGSARHPPAGWSPTLTRHHPLSPATTTRRPRPTAMTLARREFFFPPPKYLIPHDAQPHHPFARLPHRRRPRPRRRHRHLRGDLRALAGDDAAARGNSEACQPRQVPHPSRSLEGSRPLAERTEDAGRPRPRHQDSRRGAAARRPARVGARPRSRDPAPHVAPRLRDRRPLPPRDPVARRTAPPRHPRPLLRPGPRHLPARLRLRDRPARGGRLHRRSGPQAVDPRADLPRGAEGVPRRLEAARRVG